MMRTAPRRLRDRPPRFLGDGPVASTFLLFLLGPFFPLLHGRHFRRHRRTDRSRRTAPTVAVIAAAGGVRSSSSRPATGLPGHVRSDRDGQPSAASQPTGEPQQAGGSFNRRKPAFRGRSRRRPRASAADRHRQAAKRDGQAAAPVHRRGAAIRRFRRPRSTLPVLLTSPSPTAPGRGPGADRAAGQAAAVPPDAAARRHAAVPAGRGEIEQGDRGACRRRPDRRRLPRQAVGDARRFLGRDRSLGVGRGRRDPHLCAQTALAASPCRRSAGPLFILLGVVYFAMSYLLLGSIFLGIGGHASSAREVQTLSMPVTMAQVVIFAVASIAVGDPDSNRSPRGGHLPAFVALRDDRPRRRTARHLAARRRARLAIAVDRPAPQPRVAHFPQERAQVRPGAVEAEEGRPRLDERGFGLFRQPRLHGHVREGSMADPRNPGACPSGPARPAGEVHGVHR